MSRSFSADTSATRANGKILNYSIRLFEIVGFCWGAGAESYRIILAPRSWVLGSPGVQEVLVGEVHQWWESCLQHRGLLKQARANISNTAGGCIHWVWWRSQHQAQLRHCRYSGEWDAEQLQVSDDEATDLIILTKTQLRKSIYFFWSWPKL